MKTLNFLFRKGRYIFALYAMLLASCINDIPEDAKMEGMIPVTFTANIKTAVTTRVSQNRFEEKDAVGLFVCIQPDDLKTLRYADNLCFTYSMISEEFAPDKSIFYPEGDGSLNMISYYPYQEAGIENGKSTIAVSVNEDQSDKDSYSKSDFLVAEAVDKEPSENLNMTYVHKFARVKLSMKVAQGIEETALQNKNPYVTISGFNTHALYDFQDKKFSSFSNEGSVQPYGTWAWDSEEKKLVGKEAILIPQDIDQQKQIITIELDGRIYFTNLPDDVALVSGKQCEICITFQPAVDQLLSNIQGTITDWEGDKVHDTESGIITNAVDVSRLSFQESNIYKVISQGRAVAEICKEYLRAENISSQAIVVYPVNDKDETDLTKGIVMQVLGNEEKVHGGTVEWDVTNNTLNYTPGTKAVQNCFYIASNKAISLSSSGGALAVSIHSDVLRDVRERVVGTYPIVKIGTQYWMRKNLATSLYSDGVTIPKLTKMLEGGNGYLFSAPEDYFYSPKTVMTHKIAPAEWNIPTWEDWNRLRAYVKEDASVLKSGTWIPLKSGGKTSPSLNTSGFAALPAGMYIEAYHSDYEGKYAAFWTLDAAGTGMVENVFALKSDINETTTAGYTATKAFSIRCIRK